jgi:glutamate formiminotransferase/formiminotetrahydrofolate cyclodeaminase
MSQIVECVANYSEGRRSEVVDQIAQAIAAVPGVAILDRTSDADHNRSVITFAGPPDAVSEAAFQSIRTAADLIDLDTHRGEHPRLGATDVVPFVPIQGITLDDCAELARRLGQRVGDELGIPVFLYEAAATRPDRENLADVRRGEYEALKDAIAADPDRAPDFGPHTLGGAGATIIGARQPLIAYNVYLTTADVEIAKKIALAIRHSAGGLRFVKAMGLLVDGKAQVSMNLTDYTRTPVFRVVELIRREAARYSVGIESSELIGLIPQNALFDAAQWYLQIDNYTPQSALETRLAEMTHQTDLLDELAAEKSTPGGGSAAAYGGAMGAALVAMVARLTAGKKSYAQVADRMTAIADEADTLRTELARAVQIDAAAFDTIVAARRMPKDNDAKIAARNAAIQAATLHAAEVPLNSARAAARVLELAVEAAETGMASAVTDAGSAAMLAQAALTASGYNVRINVTGLEDSTAAQTLLSSLKALETGAQAHMDRLRAILNQRGNLGL